MAEKFCTRCGAPVAAGLQFCTQCGTPLQPQAAQPLQAPVVLPAPVAAPPVAAPKKPMSKDLMTVLITVAVIAVVGIIVAIASGGGKGGTGGVNPDNPLLPRGKPTSTSTINGLSVATYKDGTVAINDGRDVITPSGDVYVEGQRMPSGGPIQLPASGSSAGINGGTVYFGDGEFYIVANGSVLYIDADKTATAWDAP